MPRATRQKGVIRRFVEGVLVIIALVWVISVTGVVAFAAYEGARPADAIVVLGAAQYDGHPSPVLRARIDHAIDLWRDSTARLLVFTGGQGTGDTTSEAVVSSLYARRHGVPDQDILLENEGRTTSASMHSVSDMLRTRQMTTVVLVSDPFHMFRLWLLARRMGLRAYTSPTRTSPITTNSAKNLEYIFGESFKAPIAFLIG